MSDDGGTKDDVKVPDGEVGEKIERLFRTEEKDTSKSNFWRNACLSLIFTAVIVLTSMGEEVAIVLYRPVGLLLPENKDRGKGYHG